MAELKTQKNDASVEAFLASVADAKQREDAQRLDELMREVTGAAPAMWGPGIVGYGSYRYKYENGREIDWFLTGFSPRKANLTLYIMGGFKSYETLLEKLGKHKTGKSCLYIKRLEDVDLKVLKKMIQDSVKHLKSSSKSR